jgi:hypothetical protein
MLISGISFGQTRAITDAGDTIIVYQNGTWTSVKKKSTPALLAIGTVVTSTAIDEITNKKTISTEEWRYMAVNSKKMSLSASMYKANDIYIISLIYSGDLGCLTKDESSLRIKLSNGYIIECVQISKNDCGRLQRGDFALVSEEQSKLSDYMTIMQDNKQLLATHDWEMMRLQGSKHYTDLYPNSYKSLKSPQQFFRQHLSALERQ